MYSPFQVNFVVPTLDLDTLLGDTQCDIVGKNNGDLLVYVFLVEQATSLSLSLLPPSFTDCETAIMHKLQSHILEYSDLLMSVVECTAELDWYVLVVCINSASCVIKMIIKSSLFLLIIIQPSVFGPSGLGM